MDLDNSWDLFGDSVEDHEADRKAVEAADTDGPGANFEMDSARGGADKRGESDGSIGAVGGAGCGGTDAGTDRVSLSCGGSAMDLDDLEDLFGDSVEDHEGDRNAVEAASAAGPGADFEMDSAIGGADAPVSGEEVHEADGSIGGVGAAGRPVILWFGLPYILFVERGDVPGPHGRRKVWICSMGYCMSRTLKRLPRMTGAFWRECLRLLRIEDNANIALHTDGGECTRRNAYANVKHPGFVQHETTKHSMKQYARNCILPGRRHGITGDQVAECTWSHMTSFTRGHGASDDVGMELAVREGQWHHVVGPDADAWLLYCRAGLSFYNRLSDDLRDDHFAPQGFPEHAAAAAQALRGGDARSLPIRVRERLLRAMGRSRRVRRSQDDTEESAPSSEVSGRPSARG